MKVNRKIIIFSSIILMINFGCISGINRVEKHRIISKYVAQNFYKYVDVYKGLNQDTTAIIKIGRCGSINLNNYKSNTISELRNGDFPYHCIINYAEKQDTLAQRVLYEICDMVGDNVYRFDYLSSSHIDMFLRQTLYLTPKSNKWIPVLMKYAKDNYCESDPSSHYSAGGHFGSWVTGDIIGNLTNKDYAKELGNFQYRILQEETITNKKLDGCDLEKRRHKIFLARLEQDYKDGKLNFEQEK